MGAQVVVGAVSFLPREKVQRQGRGPRQGGPTLDNDWQQTSRAGSFPVFALRARPSGCGPQLSGGAGALGLARHGGEAAPGSWGAWRSVLSLV